MVSAFISAHSVHGYERGEPLRVNHPRPVGKALCAVTGLFDEAHVCSAACCASSYPIRGGGGGMCDAVRLIRGISGVAFSRWLLGSKRREIRIPISGDFFLMEQSLNFTEKICLRDKEEEKRVSKFLDCAIKKRRYLLRLYWKYIFSEISRDKWGINDRAFDDSSTSLFCPESRNSLLTCVRSPITREGDGFHREISTGDRLLVVQYERGGL